MEKFDLIVIGGGPAGYPAAIRAAQLGASVALVEREFLGGTCLNWGCIPTKTLLASSSLFWQLRHAADFGLSVKGAAFDYGAMAARKDRVLETLRGGIGKLLDAHKVATVAGEASFVNRSTVAVRQADGLRLLTAPRVILCAGSEAAMPGFLPRHERVVESRGFLARTELTAKLLVLGGGVIGCEFACLAAQLGRRVTVVEMLDDLLFMLDADVRRELRRHMEQTLGIRVITGRALTDVTADARGVRGRAGDETVEGDTLLVAVGRRPATQALRLDAAGVRADERGWVPVDAFGQTSAPGVYAAGDVTGRTQLAHAATAQGVGIAENLFGPRRKPLETLVPACIFTAPEIGGVGLTEQDAQKQGLAVRTGKFGFASLGKAMAINEAAGFVKWIADAATDRLLGAHAIGPHATELIAEAAVAIRAELTATELGRTIHCHPTLSEAWMEAAHALHGGCVHTVNRRRG